MEIISAWKTAIGVIISIFLAGVVSIVSANVYIETQTEKKYYPMIKAYVLEEKVDTATKSINEQTKQLSDIQEDQSKILFQIGEINGKLEIISRQYKK